MRHKQSYSCSLSPKLVDRVHELLGIVREHPVLRDKYSLAGVKPTLDRYGLAEADWKTLYDLAGVKYTASRHELFESALLSHSIGGNRGLFVKEMTRLQRFNERIEKQPAFNFSNIVTMLLTNFVNQVETELNATADAGASTRRNARKAKK